MTKRTLSLMLAVFSSQGLIQPGLGTVAPAQANSATTVAPLDSAAGLPTQLELGALQEPLGTSEGTTAGLSEELLVGQHTHAEQLQRLEEYYDEQMQPWKALFEKQRQSFAEQIEAQARAYATIQEQRRQQAPPPGATLDTQLQFFAGQMEAEKRAYAKLLGYREEQTQSWQALFETHLQNYKQQIGAERATARRQVAISQTQAQIIQDLQAQIAQQDNVVQNLQAHIARFLNMQRGAPAMQGPICFGTINLPREFYIYTGFNFPIGAWINYARRAPGVLWTGVKAICNFT